MWLRKITKRKMQFTIVMLIAMMATAILTACIAFTLETRNFVKEYYSNENCPMLFTVSPRDEMNEVLMNNNTSAKVINKIINGKAKYLKDNFYVNGQIIANEGNFVYQLSDISEAGYDIGITNGGPVNNSDSKRPADNEIWLSKVFTDAYDIKLGDKFCIGNNKTAFKVSAIVNTPICSSGFIDSYPFYLSEAALNSLQEKELYSYMLYANDSDMTLKEFQDKLPAEFRDETVFHLDKDTLDMCLSMLSGIFGGVGIAAALVIIVVSMIVYRYLVQATISKEYQMIGIYKAIGKENSDIRKTYLAAYMVSGIIGMIIGYFLARPLTAYLSNVVLGHIESFRLTAYTTVTGIAVIVLMCILLLINLCSELSKIKNISPIQAMNYTCLSSKEKVNKSLISNAHSSLAMSVNDIFKRKGTSLLVMLILTVSVYVELMAGAVYYTLSHYSDDADIWENLPAFDCLIKTDGDTKTLDYIKNSKDVKDYVQVMLSPNCTTMEIEGSDWTCDESNPMVYENFTEERYKNVPYTKGRICLEPGEITVSKKFLDGVDKKVGDYIEIRNGTVKKDFLITGSYSAMMKGGVSFYMHDSDYLELGYENEYTSILVFLKDGVDYKDFAKDFEANITESSIFKKFNFIEREGETVQSIANPICLVLFIIFAAFSLLNIINLIHTQNKENRRKYGIMKAMGFTSGYICRETIFQLSIEYIGAMIMALIIHQIISPILFSIACGVKFIRSPIWIASTVFGGTYIVLIITVLIMLLTVRHIKPVELIEE